MRKSIFIFFLTGICCLASSCGERKTKEEQSIPSSSAEDHKLSTVSEGNENIDKNEQESSSDKDDITKSVFSNNPSAEVTELNDTSKASGANFSYSEANDIAEATEEGQQIDSNFYEREELQALKQETFATVPPELSDRIHLHELPSKAAIGIMAYPNSYIIKLNNKTKYRDKFYVTMELASSDNPGQVLDFYQKGRENWYYIENSAVHTFKKDKEKYFRETNTLQILPFDKIMYKEIDSLLSFDAQTLIRIYYELPPQESAKIR